MALDPAEAMLIGRLQQSVEGLERVVSGLNQALHEFREAASDERRAVESRIAALEARNLQAQARNEGHAEGYTTGQKAGILAATIFLLYGMQATAIDLWELVQRILR